MRRHAIALLVIGTTALASLAHAEENYWHRIRDSVERAQESREAAETERAYLQSLTGEQLILAGRQCGQEVESVHGRGYVGESSLALMFVWQFYPGATDNLADMGPILAELTDRDAPTIWRLAVSESLRSSQWQELLTSEQLRQVSDAFRSVMADQTDSDFVRKVTASGSARMLCACYVSAIKPAPAVKALCEQGRNIHDVARECAQGHVELGEEYAKANSEVLELVAQYFETAAAVFADPATPPPVQLGVMVAMMSFWRYRFAAAGQTPAIVEDAFRRYAEYDQAVWQLMALYALQDLKIDGAPAVVKEMMAKTEDEELRRRLRSLLRQHEREQEKAVEQEPPDAHEG